MKNSRQSMNWSGIHLYLEQKSQWLTWLERATLGKCPGSSSNLLRTKLYLRSRTICLLYIRNKPLREWGKQQLRLRNFDKKSCCFEFLSKFLSFTFLLVRLSRPNNHLNFQLHTSEASNYRLYKGLKMRGMGRKAFLLCIFSQILSDIQLSF